MHSVFTRRFCSVKVISAAAFNKSVLTTNACKYETLERENYVKSKAGLGIALSLSIFGFTLKYEEETDKLETLIKRSILCIQREQYDKAEIMLHLALRMAQDLHSVEGITYVYDVMANLAMEREQFKKAEKLYTEVMKRLMADGHTEESPKILHISSKLAHLADMQGELSKSNLGFTWTIKTLEKCIDKNPENEDIRELLGLTQNWFGQLLIKQNNFETARKYLKSAYECFIKTHDSAEEECITILNNLSVACVKLERYSEAKLYLMKALELISAKNSPQQAIIQANLGLIYLKQGLINEAKSMCTQAWRFGTNKNDSASIKQAGYCFDEIKKFEMISQ